MSQIQITAPVNRFRFWEYLETELLKGNAFLLPLRLFIGLGWLRAGVEKMVDPVWRSGDKVASFFDAQLAADAVYFPFYETLITQFFAPNAFAFSWIVLFGELAAGIAILTGTLTNLALLGGLFMNLNFVLAGVVNPSAFYIMNQGALLSANAGMILGGDSLLAGDATHSAAERAHHSSSDKSSGQWLPLLSSILCGFAAVLAVPYIRDFGPHSVDDPVMLLFILLMLGAMLLGIHFVHRSAMQGET